MTETNMSLPTLSMIRHHLRAGKWHGAQWIVPKQLAQLQGQDSADRGALFGQATLDSLQTRWCWPNQYMKWLKRCSLCVSSCYGVY